jgi:hypothetical protein
MIELLCTEVHRFDGGVREQVNRKIPAKSSNKLQTRDCHFLLAWYSRLRPGYPTTAHVALPRLLSLTFAVCLPRAQGRGTRRGSAMLLQPSKPTTHVVGTGVRWLCARTLTLTTRLPKRQGVLGPE